ncbi:MAG: type II toxin-antitoxin system VapC family toxin [Candidatus Aenigmarchaeota archaeon]|nr:type II toxin-antitoxin system VapC family toxin [Candidatus Aenigmarchaeota archaeon]
MILLDTSFVVAYYNTEDNNHNKAAVIMKGLIAGEYGDIFITDYIFDEIATIAFVRLKNLNKTIEIGEAVNNLAKIDYIGKDIFEDTWNLFKGQKATRFSFTDCSTLSMMKKRGIKNIATFDEDFEKIREIEVVAG